MAQVDDEASSLATVEGFTAAWLAQDIARLAALMAEDFTLWNNCSGVELRKPESTRYFGALAAMIRSNAYSDIRRYRTPTGVVQQNLASFETVEGKFADIPLMLVFTLRGGLISRCEAYLDSTGLAELPWPDGSPFF